MAYSLSNKCAKKFCKRSVLVQLLVKDVVTFFWNILYICVFYFIIMSQYYFSILCLKNRTTMINIT